MEALQMEMVMEGKPWLMKEGLLDNYLLKHVQISFIQLQLSPQQPQYKHGAIRLTEQRSPVSAALVEIGRGAA
jgi:hypothetical protein